MPHPKEPPESPDKGEESGDGQAKTERFRNLTKGLLAVPLADVRAIERDRKKPRH